MADAIFSKRFERLIKLSPSEHRIVESIRFRDQDLSAKGAAVLAFSGILIAASLVQFSVPQDAIVRIEPNSAQEVVCLVNLFLLFVSVWMLIISFILTRTYSDNPCTAIVEFDDLVARRRLYYRIGLYIAGICSVVEMIVLFWPVIGFALQRVGQAMLMH